MGRKKKFVGKDKTIGIYRFMEMCGLQCNYNENVHVSHKIMKRKIDKRHDLFPDQISVPMDANIKRLQNEDINTGSLVAVTDQCKNTKVYKNPLNTDLKTLEQELREKSSEEELQKIRREKLRELGYEIGQDGKIYTKEEMYELKRREQEKINNEYEEYIFDNLSRSTKIFEKGHGRIRIKHRY